MKTITPESFAKRSFVYRCFSDLDVQYTELDDASIVSQVADLSSHSVRPGLSDLSVLERQGYRGINAAELLEANGFPVPMKPNQAVETASGELVLRLSSKEFWVLNSPEPESEGVKRLAQAELPKQDCYPLYCQDSHALFVVTGPGLADIMAKVCGVDLHPAVFPSGVIVQTSIARVSAIVVHHQLKGMPAFFILSDSASSEYLWGALQDAMQEYNGQIVGLNSLI